ncbi:MAG: O-antigen ligase family protein, partial [Acidobacteria bacterium]|nr:O-antigen ligase family protein [Acidobacteriota bacterium]
MISPLAGSKHPTNLLNEAAYVLTLLAVILPVVSIAVAQIFLALAILAFSWERVRTRTFKLAFPPIATPLLLFMAWTLVALLVSSEPQLGLPPVNKFWLFSIVVLICNLFDLRRAVQACHAFCQMGVLASALCIGQFLTVFQVNVETRLTGFMGHWMTLSGELMLVFAVMAGFLLFARPKRPVFWLTGLSAVGLALSLTLTRSVWLATLAGLLVLLLMKHWHWKTLVIAASTVVALLLAAPVVIQRRVQSVVDFNDPSNYARIAIWRAGLRMVQAHPWVGVGPQRVSKVFYDYHPHPEDRNRSGF